MKIGRREFLKLSGCAAVAVAASKVPSLPPQAKNAALKGMKVKFKGLDDFVIDLDKAESIDIVHYSERHPTLYDPVPRVGYTVISVELIGIPEDLQNEFMRGMRFPSCRLISKVHKINMRAWMDTVELSMQRDLVRTNISFTEIKGPEDA